MKNNFILHTLLIKPHYLRAVFSLNSKDFLHFTWVFSIFFNVSKLWRDFNIVLMQRKVDFILQNNMARDKEFPL